MIAILRRLALPIAITSAIVNAVFLAAAFVLWYLAIRNHWLESVTFVSHISLLALVFSGISGVAAAIAGILALVPTEETP